MGLLRAICILVSLVSLAAGLLSFTHGSAIGAVIPLILGIGALVSITPFAAYSRARRNRVLKACMFYAAAAGVSSVAIVASQPTPFNFAMLILPLVGVVLSVWAYRTRNRRRVIGFSNYYRE